MSADSTAPDVGSRFFSEGGFWPCAFCGATCSIGKVEGRHGVMHAMPMCPKFKELSMEEFVHACYQRRVPQSRL